ncbi:MAG: S8 family serine peptidase, partial [Saprospiraceae bacterium]|nr:S8 family serine peptidase [Saprospiraceae bacterium]
MSNLFLKFILFIQVRRAPVLRMVLWSLSLFAGNCALFAQTQLMEKCSPALSQAVQQREDTPLRLALVVADLSVFRQWAGREGLVVLADYPPANIILLEDRSAHFWDKTLPRPDVLFADFGYTTAREELTVPGHNLFTNNIRLTHTLWPDLDGSGVTVSIKEFRFDSTDIDITNRYLPMAKASPTLTVHAGTMATLAAGAGNSDAAGRGVARGSRLLSSNFAGLLPDTGADYEQFQVRVQNHSYGLDIENYYGAGAVAYDQTTQDHPGLLHVFSAGNIGTTAPVSGYYANVAGFANLTGNFKMAKNAVVVGAVDSFGVVTSYSSRGPAFDGRTKPDLVAFGQGGTSEAAALVSGAAAVVQQAFYEKYGQWPASEATRAILIGSTDDTGAPGPDFESGFGNLNLKKAIDLIRHHSIQTASVGPGEIQSFFVELPDNVHEFCATLTWNDPPSLPNAPRALVNDLDLELIAPDGRVWQPGVLRTAPHRDSLLLPARPGRDSINNTEQIRLDRPDGGFYELRVSGYLLPDGVRPFALAAHWDTLQFFQWTSPEGATLTSGETALLSWQTDLVTDPGQLSWKPVGHLNWETIDSAVDPRMGYLRWAVPHTFTAAQVRMRIGALEFTTDTFLISPVLRLRVGFNCPDSVLLRWNAAGPDATYRLWALGNRYLEPMLHATDTSLILKKSNFPQLHFAVSAATLNGNVEGVTSGAPNIAAQGVGCYINNLLALLDDDGESIRLTLDLGSIYGVNRVFFEKQIGGDWQIIRESPPPGLQVQHTDLLPQQGANTYRARLTMDNGGTLTSEPVVVYVAGARNFLVFPNPVRPGQTFSLLANTEDEAPKFLLCDPLGRPVLEQAVENFKTDLIIPALAPGVYGWRVAGASGKVLSA